MEVITPIFHPFPRLPTEIRLQIWHLAIPEGVYIHLYRRPTQEHVSQHLIARCSPHPVPSMLHTNSEARFVALPYFSLLGTGPSMIYFNPAVDTLMLGLIFRTNCEAITFYPKMILGEGVDLLQHIAVYNLPFYSRWFEEPILRSFRSLSSFAILDMREWEEELRGKKTDWNSRGLVDYEELRNVLSAKVLRAENLVRVTEVELQARDRTTRELYRLINLVQVNWIALSGIRRMDCTKVMRLPFPGEEAWKEMKIRGMLGLPSSEQVATGDCVAGKGKRDGSLRKPWRYLRKLYSGVAP